MVPDEPDGDGRNEACQKESHRVRKSEPLSRLWVGVAVIVVILVVAGWCFCLLPAPAEAEAQLPIGSSYTLGSITHPTPANHKVEEGENLHWLAGYYYGNARLWRFIYEANREQLKDPNFVPAGIVLTIPQLQ